MLFLMITRMVHSWIFIVFFLAAKFSTIRNESIQIQGWNFDLFSNWSLQNLQILSLKSSSQQKWFAKHFVMFGAVFDFTPPKTK